MLKMAYDVLSMVLIFGLGVFLGTGVGCLVINRLTRFNETFKREFYATSKTVLTWSMYALIVLYVVWVGIGLYIPRSLV